MDNETPKDSAAADQSFWDDVPDEAAALPFFRFGNLRDGDAVELLLTSECGPSKVSKHSLVEFQAIVKSDGQEYLFAISSTRLAAGLKKLRPRKAEALVVHVEGRGMDRTYVVERDAKKAEANHAARSGSAAPVTAIKA